MTHCEWLEEHGFIKIKDHWNGNWNYRTYQKNIRKWNKIRL